MIRIYPANAHAHTHTHTHAYIDPSAHSFLQAKTEAEPGLCVCASGGRWDRRSGPRSPPFSRTVCSTHTGCTGARMADGTKSSSCMCAKKKKKTDTHILTHAICPVPASPLHCIALHCCPLSVKDTVLWRCMYACNLNKDRFPPVMSCSGYVASWVTCALKTCKHTWKGISCWNYQQTLKNIIRILWHLRVRLRR